jgi:hypothetical protein
MIHFYGPLIPLLDEGGVGLRSERRRGTGELRHSIDGASSKPLIGLKMSDRARRTLAVIIVAAICGMLIYISSLHYATKWMS